MTLRIALVCMLLAGAIGDITEQVPLAPPSTASIHVSVRSDGRAIRDLSSAEFTVREANVPQQVTAIDAANSPLDITLVVQEYRRRKYESVETFGDEVAAVTQSLGSKDRLRVAFAGDDQREQPSPLLISLDPAAFRNRVCVPVYDAVARALMKPVVAGREHVVILITTTEGTGSVLNSEAVTEIARRSSARLEVIAVDEPANAFGRYDVAAPRCTSAGADWSPERQAQMKHIESASSTDRQRWEFWAEGRKRLSELAKLTGGGEIQATLVRGSRLGPLREAFDEWREGYILSYVPAGVPATGWRQINVSINRTGDYEVRARPGLTR